MSTAIELQRIIDSKAAIKTAIESKGVTVGNGTIDTYAAKVDAIQTGVVVGTGTYLVRFFDFDGTILKQQRVNAGESATAPTIQTHQYLTFNSWNNAFTNVQGDIDTGAIYDTTDGKSYLFITLTTVTGLSPTLYFYKSTTSLMTINWGDGTTSTSTTSGNQNIAHTYAAAGDYVITVQNSAGGTYTFGDGTNQLTGSLTYKTIITNIYCGKYIIVLNGKCFYQNYSLINISLPKDMTTFGGDSFNGCSRLIHLTYPYDLINFGYGATPYCYSLRNVVFPNRAVSFPSYTNFICYSLQKILIPNLVTTILSAAFKDCSAVTSIYLGSGLTYIQCTFNCTSVIDIVSLATTPPTLYTNDAFATINPITKIYVPDASVAAYKAATNWVTYANYIYPLSSKP